MKKAIMLSCNRHGPSTVGGLLPIAGLAMQLIAHPNFEATTSSASMAANA